MFHSIIPFAIVALIVIQPASYLAQQRQAQTQTNPQERENTVRISTQLVQIDATVTDKKGNHVEDLTEEDFELMVDGRKQTLTYFRPVKIEEAKPEETGRASDRGAATVPPAMPAKAIRPEQVRRTIAFVVDDLGLSFESTYYARRALKKFVDEQMQEGDLVAIIRTGRGLGALQQFTGDKRILYAAIEKLTWNPDSRDRKA
jgi:VWFA-related protein